MDGEKDVFEMKNEEESVQFIQTDAAIASLTDALTGILKTDFEVNPIREEILHEKYEFMN